MIWILTPACNYSITNYLTSLYNYERHINPNDFCTTHYWINALVCRTHAQIVTEPEVTDSAGRCIEKVSFIFTRIFFSFFSSLGLPRQFSTLTSSIHSGGAQSRPQAHQFMYRTSYTSNNRIICFHSVTSKNYKMAALFLSLTLALLLIIIIIMILVITLN